eukprot:6214752-Pleurochrysis_carterae.AAC.1
MLDAQDRGSLTTRGSDAKLPTGSTFAYRDALLGQVAVTCRCSGRAGRGRRAGECGRKCARTGALPGAAVARISTKVAIVAVRVFAAARFPSGNPNNESRQLP